MRNNKAGKRIILIRNVGLWLIVTTAAFGGTACCRKDASVSSDGTDTRDPAHTSEPVKVGNTVFATQRDLVEKMPERCSTMALSAEKRREIQQKLKEFEETNPTRRQARSVKVRVYFHVITSTKGEGDVSDGTIEHQIDVLNYAFAPTPFMFELAGTDRTANDDWFDMMYSEPAGDAERQAKASLNRGDKSTLNIYSVNLFSTAFGWARWPWDFADGIDGVVLGHRTLPGGETAHFNMGYTAVHEVGHWLGLFHTFENGCDPGGDSVDDTPDEDGPARYCPVARNSCESTGYDPVDNFMDFTWDTCMNNFTSGQSVRMDDVHQQYRQ